MKPGDHLLKTKGAPVFILRRINKSKFIQIAYGNFLIIARLLSHVEQGKKNKHF